MDRFNVPLEVLVAKYGNVELYRHEGFNNPWYCSDKIAEIKVGVDMISVEVRQSVCLAPIMKVKDLISCGAAKSVTVHKEIDGDRNFWTWPVTVPTIPKRERTAKEW